MSPLLPQKTRIQRPRQRDCNRTHQHRVLELVRAGQRDRKRKAHKLKRILKQLLRARERAPPLAPHLRLHDHGRTQVVAPQADAAEDRARREARRGDDGRGLAPEEPRRGGQPERLPGEKPHARAVRRDALLEAGREPCCGELEDDGEGADEADGEGREAC